MSAPESQWPAPAKLNLFLHVTGRRADGYHELQTLFQLIDLCDTITIALREDGRIERPAGPAGVAPHADLTVRAALALQQATGTARGADLRVHKRIPPGAGLGGGSADAAAVLRWAGVTDLALAASLGADVPFFLEGGTVLGLERGDVLFPLIDAARDRSEIGRAHV